MRAILIDDEEMPLLHLRRLLEYDMDGIDVIGTFSDPVEAIVQARLLQPDVVFLDINMPKMNGLDAGEQLQTTVPAAEIVFVTGYDKYAVDAFDLCALDYVMKPVQVKRLQKTIQRLRERLADVHVEPASAESAKTKPSLSISCFKRMEFSLSGAEPQTIKWRTTKARELFAYLLHHRNRMFDKEMLLELLWPECDVAKGITQLYTTVYLIRQTLKRCGLADFLSIERSNLETGYKLIVGDVRFDTEEWERSIVRAEGPDLLNTSMCEQLLDRYTGDYFGEYEYVWAEHERERLRRLWLHLAQKLTRLYVTNGMLQEAIQVYVRIQQLFLLEEGSYLSLMKLYDATDNFAAVEDQFILLKTRWEQELDSTVNDEIKDWYDCWKRDRSGGIYKQA